MTKALTTLVMTEAQVPVLHLVRLLYLQIGRKFNLDHFHARAPAQT